MRPRMIFWCVLALLAIGVLIGVYGGWLSTDGGPSAACPVCGIFFVLLVAGAGAVDDLLKRRREKK